MSQLFFGSDHAGFELKQYLMEKFKDEYEVIDCGPESMNPGDDYPDYAQKVVTAVLKNPQSKGVLICDTGIGVCIAANRYKGIRAALATSSFMAERSRLHEDANILCLGSHIATKQENETFLRTWLATDFSGEERHIRRMKSLDHLN